LIYSFFIFKQFSDVSGTECHDGGILFREID